MPPNRVQLEFIRNYSQYCNQWLNCFLGPYGVLAAIPRVATGEKATRVVLPVGLLVLTTRPLFFEILPPLCAERDLVSGSAHRAPVFITRSSTQLINQNRFHE